MHLVLTTVLVGLLTVAGSSARQSTLSPEQQRSFLLTASITGSRLIGKGITGSSRLTLSDGAVTHDAAFQSIEDRTSQADRLRFRKRAGELNFADSYKFNIAAYEIARLLGLGHMMPVTVERRWKGQIGSLAWWIDDVLMDENEREKQNAQPPSAIEFYQQRQRMVVFAELIRDTDRNKGNILYTKDWRVIMIDFTRAFRQEPELRQPDTLNRCDGALLQRLRTITDGELKQAVDRHLTTNEIAGVLARRKLIVDRFTRLIQERGDKAVLY